MPTDPQAAAKLAHLIKDLAGIPRHQAEALVGHFTVRYETAGNQRRPVLAGPWEPDPAALAEALLAA